MKAKIINEGLRYKLTGPNKEDINKKINKHYSKELLSYINKLLNNIILDKNNTTINFINKGNIVMIYNIKNKELYLEDSLFNVLYDDNFIQTEKLLKYLIGNKYKIEISDVII